MSMTIKFRPVPAAVDVDDVFADGAKVGRIEQSETYKDRFHLILNNRPAELVGYNLSTARRIAKERIPTLLANLGTFDEVAEKNPPRRIESIERTVKRFDYGEPYYKVLVKTTFLDDSTQQYDLGPYDTLAEAQEAAAPNTNGTCKETVVLDASVPTEEPANFVEATILTCVESNGGATTRLLAELVAERMPTGERIPTAELIDACCNLEERGLLERFGTCRYQLAQ